MRGQEEIAEMMQGYRNNPPTTINGVRVVHLLDYQLQVGKNLVVNEIWDITLQKAMCYNSCWKTAQNLRPSEELEPKIKFYFSVNTKLANKDAYDETHAMLMEPHQGRDR